MSTPHRSGTSHGSQSAEPGGIDYGPTSPFWVNRTTAPTSRRSTTAPGMIVPLVVNVPGNPTGIAFNGSSGVPGHFSNGGRALFLFAGEGGAVSGWNPAAGGSASRRQGPVGQQGGCTGAGHRHRGHRTPRLWHSDQLSTLAQWTCSAPTSAYRGSFTDTTVGDGFCAVQRAERWRGTSVRDLREAGCRQAR